METLHNVDIYYNLHKKLWSVKCRKTGIVLRHARTIIARSPVKFVVQAAGRARAVRSGQKNVHAFVRCDIVEIDRVAHATRAYAGQRVSYVPSYAPTFYTCKDREPIHGAAGVVMIASPYAAPQCLATE